MPATIAPSTLPRIFRRPRLLIVGCGDVGLRVAQCLRERFRLRALTSTPSRRDTLRQAGVVPLLGNLDQPLSLRRLSALCPRVLHLAPPKTVGLRDVRTQSLLRVLSQSTVTERVVYCGTTGVYGDCQGAKFNETRMIAPHTARAHRRANAEQQMRAFGRKGRCTTLLRVPGIYALDREGGPAARLERGSPVLRPQEDVYTNHIHADDLARACIRALLIGKPQRVIHVCDDTEMKMGDYFDWAAQLLGMVAPPRITRAQGQLELSDMALSFMSESRRLRNDRLKRELRLTLHYPTLAHALKAAGPSR